MKIIVFSLLTFFCMSLMGSNTTQEQVTYIVDLINSDPDSATKLASELLIKSNSSKDEYGIVQSNYILAYVNEKNGNHGKAIIYYLEAIRIAQKSSNDAIEQNLISLYKNCGVIFRKFKAFDLAEEYYLKSLNVAIETEDLGQQLSINYNLARVYRESGNELLSIEVLEKYLPLTEKLSPTYFNYINRLGVSYFNISEYQKSISFYEKIIKQLGDLDNEMKGYAYHNLAKAYKAMGDYESSNESYNKALEIKHQIGDNQQIFSSYFGKGQLLIETGDLLEAKEYLLKAESIMLTLKNDPESFEIYNTISNLYFEFKDFEKSKSYKDLYISGLNDFIKTQEQFQENNRRDNIDLITKRYLDEVAKQEKIASILLYSRLTSGSLLVLLLSVIGYTRYEKFRVRRSIEKQLLSLEMID